MLLKAPDVWVKKWVDYSSKYGLGYLLSNNQTGVFFNDSTKVILDLSKKVTLLQHFRSYLENN
jgi:polo-like kinase 1